MESFQIVGVSAAVVKDNQVVWSNEYGWSDLDREIAVTQDTVFRIASISKLFVATSLMQQYEQGKFHLDDDISDYLSFSFRTPHHPDVPITFRQLLTHTTSLNEDETGGELYVVFSQASRKSDPPTMEDLLVPGGSLYVDSLWSSFQPGDPRCFAYSNLASMIVAALVEKMSGERFDQYCREHILRPLDMSALTSMCRHLLISTSLESSTAWRTGNFVPALTIAKVKSQSRSTGHLTPHPTLPKGDKLKVNDRVLLQIDRFEVKERKVFGTITRKL